MKTWGFAALSFIAGLGISAGLFRYREVKFKTALQIERLTDQLNNKNEKIEDCPAPAPLQCGPSNEILPPPKFYAKLPDPLQTNREGEVKVSWMEVAGAKSYSIYVTDLQGKPIKKYTTTRGVIYLKEIPTPNEVEKIDYKVFLTTVNGKNLDGPRSEGRLLKINKQATVVAPTVKQIVIED